MAEIFGTVAGALRVAALFNNCCVDCFECVQLGRRFGRDYERCQLRVKIAQTRLSRCITEPQMLPSPLFKGSRGMAAKAQR